MTEALLEAGLAVPQKLEFELWVWTSAIHSQALLRSALTYAIQHGLSARGIHLQGEKQMMQLLPSRMARPQAGETPTAP